MELKQYQQDTLDDLAAYMRQVSEDQDLRKAYANFWMKKGIDISTIDNNRFIHSYDNSTVPGIPRVMFKVPTAGGKTFIASNALKVIFDHLPAERPKVVAWFVPSDSILKQTYRNLSDPEHPYRQRINTHFNNRVVVVDKETALAGTGIQPGQIREQLTIFVLSVQSFAANNKDGRRVFRENSSLADYAKAFGSGERIEGADETSLIQAIAHLNPVVIIDESHNFEAKLRVEMFQQINPSFILDLTATPREKSNIISFVDAKKLKDANMVKLPIILYNRDNTIDVLFNAITLRNTLEKRAEEIRKKGGRYIRPIVLVQAQPKSDKDNETFDKVKQKLIDAGISETWIKIKTAEKDELKGLDLLSEDCVVRYIITVNALKEGWDCPFAYILASLANKTSRIDVEQIVGRVLRLPYTTKHADEFLNLSYVFTSSNNFRETVESVIKGLNNAGFSAKDTRVIDTIQSFQEEQHPNSSSSGLFYNTDDSQNVKNQKEQATCVDENIEENDDNDFSSDDLKAKLEMEEAKETSKSENERNGIYFEMSESEGESTITDEILKQAHVANDNYEKENKEDNHSNIPSDIKDKVKMYTIKEDFKEVANQMILPVFMRKVNTSNIFNPQGHTIKLTKTILTEGFELEKADKNINFTRTEEEAVRIDLEKRGEGEYVPKQYKMNSEQISALREMFVGYEIEGKRNQLIGKIAKRLHFDEVNEPHISNYIRDVLKDKNDEELMDLFDNDLLTERAFKQKIDSLVADYQQKNFKTLLDKGQIVCEEIYQLPKSIIAGNPVTGLSKGLYLEEDGDINNFEYSVIAAVANLENVLFWHRNPERGEGFCINGFLNHYPDFIIHTQNDHIILLETKGDDRDNSDSRRKLELGKFWANKAGDKYRYFMVFDKRELDGAYTKEKFLEILKEL
ncbi:MAG: DEAD/DEAH box helicase family protein [Paludibacteraceae bacterium]|nr:DEAD/DEAH box helicase family protein [Paludibacteraceae bacterium]